MFSLCPDVDNNALFQIKITPAECLLLKASILQFINLFKNRVQYEMTLYFNSLDVLKGLSKKNLKKKKKKKLLSKMLLTLILSLWPP